MDVHWPVASGPANMQPFILVCRGFYYRPRLCPTSNKLWTLEPGAAGLTQLCDKGCSSLLAHAATGLFAAYSLWGGSSKLEQYSWRINACRLMLSAKVSRLCCPMLMRKQGRSPTGRLISA